MSTRSRAALVAIAAAVGAMPAARAAEGFVVRYNLAGSLGGEMFAAPDHAGPIAAVTMTSVDVRKVTDNDGNAQYKDLPGGKIPYFIPQAMPTYPGQRVSVKVTGQLTQWNVAFGYVTTERYGGGRLIAGINIPYATKKTQSLEVARPKTPPLSYPNPFLPTAFTKPFIESAFNTTYQTRVQNELIGPLSAESTETSGIGDAELSLGWIFADKQWRVVTGASLVMPTGKYSASPGTDVGDGNFYTLRPSLQVSYLPRPDIAVGGLMTLGFNTENRDSKVRSGDWASIEGAAAYMTRLGPIGVHALHIEQYKDDTGGMFGPSRFRSSNVGVFWTTRLPVVDTLMTLQYMTTTSSRNARHGDFMQVRFVKLF